MPKPQVFGAEVGTPLFWAERKSVDFWRVLVVDLGAAAVVDVSRGSGMAARAALDLGLRYFGVARNSYHAGWLHIAVDRAAVLGVIAGTGQASASLASSLFKPGDILLRWNHGACGQHVRLAWRATAASMDALGIESRLARALREWSKPMIPSLPLCAAGPVGRRTTFRGSSTDPSPCPHVVAALRTGGLGVIAGRGLCVRSRMRRRRIGFPRRARGVSFA